MRKINLAIYVHDLVPEIGHSRALIETINNIPTESIDKIQVVSFQMASASKIFPKFNENQIEFIKVPKLIPGPFLFTMIYYYLASWLITRTRINSDAKKIGIGIASLSVDYVNIQFIHREWDSFYFKNLNLGPLVYLYKKLLFFCFYLGENYLYKMKTTTKFSVLSQFETEYLKDEFKVPENKILTNYSGINLDNFKLTQQSRESIYAQLKSEYPQLATIDITKPIYLFVGAFERKGLPIILNKIKEVPEAQLIIIGKPESHGKTDFPTELNISYIPFTKKISLFYELSDCFLFPTIYEPFGLVIAEAACMGLIVSTTRYKVGATELLEDMEEIHIVDDPLSLQIPILDRPLSLERRNTLRAERLKRLEEMTWEKTGATFWKLLINP